MEYGIKSEMWKYQDQTCRSFQTGAKEFFDHFSSELNPEILLIGLQNDIPEYPTICTVPQNEEIKNYFTSYKKVHIFTIYFKKL